MANGGWFGTDAEWKCLEQGLLRLDPILEEFARRSGTCLSKNAKDIPERSLSWGTNPRCLIQIFPENLKTFTWNLWMCCTMDREQKRYWRNEYLFKDKEIAELEDGLEISLEASKRVLDNWRNEPEALQFVVDIE